MTSPSASTSFWHHRPVFVTGATGLVGSWLVAALSARGASVICLVRDNAPSRGHRQDGPLSGVRIVNGSLTDSELLRRTFAQHEIQTVFHLGAQTVVGVAKTDPVGTLEANVRGTWNILDAARTFGVKQTLVASSVLVAATDGTSPALTLSGAQAPMRFPYEVSKICAERIAQTYASSYKMPVGILRFGNLYGGGDFNFSRLIPGAVRATLRGERFQFRSDGKLMRDFLYVEDAVSAYIRIAECLAIDPAFGSTPFHFGSGQRHSVLETVQMILQLAGRSDIQPYVGSTPSPDLSEEALDSTEAKERMGWAPQCGLEEGLQRTVAWYQHYFQSEKDLLNLFAAAQDKETKGTLC